MKKQCLVLLATLSLSLMPTTSSALTLGDATYRVAAGCGGLVCANASIGFAGASLYCGVISGGSVAGACALGNPAPLVIAVPAACGSVITGALSLGCAYLSCRCFGAMLAPIEPEIVHIHHYHHDDAQTESAKN